jgi:hypothetical protein
MRPSVQTPEPPKETNNQPKKQNILPQNSGSQTQLQMESLREYIKPINLGCYPDLLNENVWGGRQASVFVSAPSDSRMLPSLQTIALGTLKMEWPCEQMKGEK